MLDVTHWDIEHVLLLVEKHVMASGAAVHLFWNVVTHAALRARNLHHEIYLGRCTPLPASAP